MEETLGWQNAFVRANKRCPKMAGNAVCHCSVEKLYRCIFLVTSGISERTPEDRAGLHLSCGVE